MRQSPVLDKGAQKQKVGTGQSIWSQVEPSGAPSVPCGPSEAHGLFFSLVAIPVSTGSSAPPGRGSGGLKVQTAPARGEHCPGEVSKGTPGDSRMGPQPRSRQDTGMHTTKKYLQMKTGS